LLGGSLLGGSLQALEPSICDGGYIDFSVL
jgi:hypothetical protein